MSGLAMIVNLVITLFIWALIARVILDAVQTVSPQWRPRGFMLYVAETVYTITDRPVALVRRLLPPVRLGPIMLDLGFLALLIGLQILQRVIVKVL
jgi:YggT family protein